MATSCLIICTILTGDPTKSYPFNIFLTSAEDKPISI